jgi:hypothetical protein
VQVTHLPYEGSVPALIDEFTCYLADQSTRHVDIIKKGNIKIE